MKWLKMFYMTTRCLWKRVGSAYRKHLLCFFIRSTHTWNFSVNFNRFLHWQCHTLNSIWFNINGLISWIKLCWSHNIQSLKQLYEDYNNLELRIWNIQITCQIKDREGLWGGRGNMIRVHAFWRECLFDHKAFYPHTKNY